MMAYKCTKCGGDLPADLTAECPACFPAASPRSEMRVDLSSKIRDRPVIHFPFWNQSPASLSGYETFRPLEVLAPPLDARPAQFCGDHCLFRRPGEADNSGREVQAGPGPAHAVIGMTGGIARAEVEELKSGSGVSPTGSLR